MNKKLYTHTTSGGAQYLMDTFISWKHEGKSGKEGTVNESTRLLIRMDGKYPELIHNAAAEERDQLLEVLKALVNCPDYKGINTHEMTAARAAIAKAEGN